MWNQEIKKKNQLGISVSQTTLLRIEIGDAMEVFLFSVLTI